MDRRCTSLPSPAIHRRVAHDCRVCSLHLTVEQNERGGGEDERKEEVDGEGWGRIG
jgi:hypothetical protein